MPKYLKTWPGYTESTGIGMGDSGGYPTTKLSLIDGIDRLVSTYDEKATYYRLVEIDLSETVKVIKENLGGDND